MNKLIPSEAPVLILDASCLEPFVGIWKRGVWLASAKSCKPALEGLFEALEDCLASTQLTLEDMAAFIHDEGPGSTLGIRVSSMAIRTWKTIPGLESVPVFACRSLELLSQILLQEFNEPFTLLSDYRKTIWLGLDSRQGAIRTFDESDLKQLCGSVFYLQQRKAFSGPPGGAKQVDFNLAQHPELLCEAKLFRLVDVPDVFAVEKVEYKRWQVD